jgi:hypothetical protein
LSRRGFCLCCAGGAARLPSIAVVPLIRGFLGRKVA